MQGVTGRKLCHGKGSKFFVVRLGPTCDNILDGSIFALIDWPVILGLASPQLGNQLLLLPLVALRRQLGAGQETEGKKQPPSSKLMLCSSAVPLMLLLPHASANTQDRRQSFTRGPSHTAGGFSLFSCPDFTPRGHLELN